jgi:hypothetical protein
VSTDYIFEGLRLHRDQPDYVHLCRHHPAARASFPAQRVAALAGRLGEAGQRDPGVWRELWRSCGEAPMLTQVIEAADWTDLAPVAAMGYVRLLAGLDWTAGNASFHSRRLRAMREVDKSYVGKFRVMLEPCFDWRLLPDQLRELAPPAVALVKRLARRPFRQESHAARVMSSLIEHSLPEDRTRLLEAPDRCWRQLERACFLHNNERLIAAGVDSLVAAAPAFAVEACVVAPHPFLPAAKLLGTLNEPLRMAVVREFVAAGTAEGTVRERLTALELRTLAELASGLTEVAETVPVSVLHALQMKHLIGENRAAFRKFLRAYLRGDDDYLLSHPRTRAWLYRHPRLDLARWLRGVRVVRSIGAGTVRLAIERDPLEALRLGTYVGSCLGLGGSFAHSAAAVVLDANKQVIYARDQRGTVVARQLVAITEQDRVVCFAVDPCSAGDDLRAAFRAYDRKLARALGMPLYAGGAEEYMIATILAQEWYDDRPRIGRIGAGSSSPAAAAELVAADAAAVPRC